MTTLIFYVAGALALGSAGLGVLFFTAVAWILIIAFTDWTTSTEIESGGGEKPRFDVVRS